MGKSWHQSAQNWLHGPACGMCHEAYAWSDQTVWPCSHLCSLKNRVSRVHRKIYVAWQHHWSVLSTSHGVLLMTRAPPPPPPSPTPKQITRHQQTHHDFPFVSSNQLNKLHTNLNPFYFLEFFNKPHLHTPGPGPPGHFRQRRRSGCGKTKEYCLFSPQTSPQLPHPPRMRWSQHLVLVDTPGSFYCLRSIFLGKGTFSGTKGYLVLPPTFGTRHATLILFFSHKRSFGGYPRVILVPPVLPLGVGDEEGP